MTGTQKRGVLYAILAAVFYSLNAPLSKLLLGRVPATMMAALLYLGAGLGMALFQAIGKGRAQSQREESLSRADLPYTIGMIVLDIAAPIFLMLGLSMTSAANASLLNNFEIVATSLIALLIFREAISPKLWLGIGLVTLSSLLLSFQDMSSLSFSVGSLLVLLACVCWGFENNCTRALSKKSPVQIVVVKGIFSGLGSLVIALLTGEAFPDVLSLVLTLCLGFVAYGLSIAFYVYAQRELGAAKTSAYYAIAPFIGTFLSLIIFAERPTLIFWAALVIMMLGTYVVTVSDNA